MANQKAIRSEVEFPPLLNLQEDRPRVASDFRSVEHINAPYINGMLMPFWHKRYEYTNKPVWDLYNNKYEIIDGFLTKNGNNLFAVEDYHFEKEDVTEEYSQYMAFDFSNDGKLAKMEWNTGSNSVSLTFNGTTITQENLFVNGVVLTSRVRVVGNTAIGIVVYEVGNTLKMLYMNTAANRKQSVDITWCTTTPKSSSDTNTFVNTAITVKNPSPIINICNPLTNVIGVSLISNYGEVLYTRKEGYFTFVDNNGSYVYGTNWAATGGSSTEVIQNYQFTNFSFSYSWSTTPSTFKVYQRNNKWYYRDNPTTEVPNSSDISFNPSIIPGETFTYNNVTYNVYNAMSYANRIVFTSYVDDLHSHSASISVSFNDGTTETATYTNNKATIDHTYNAWTSMNLKPGATVITYNSNTYNVDNVNKQYTITETLAPTTQSANYITAPQVFLDNGNLYSWYTIPEAPASNNMQPISLPDGTLLVESGTLTAISGNNYTFGIIEAHLVNSYTVFARENSIAIEQNFWASSMKMASSGCLAPYNLYTVKQNQGSFSASVKYTEYSNSNCCDMLYYAGTLPRNDQKFYKDATAGSEDVAWFNPGGYRSNIKNNWNIMYYIGSTGEVAMQGISYGEGNKMGTLITPFASIGDTSYISASNDFVVYSDSNNKYWKISVEEGAQLSAIFDNQYIVVNTTSYWNMWDANKNMKFHYATDYNNRAKMGLTRTEYRSTISTYFTYADRRKYATSINQSYNNLPRLPVTSMLPSTLSLSHTPYEDDISPYTHTYYCEADEAREVQAIDVYFQGRGSSDTSCRYICSIKVFSNTEQIYRDGNIVDTVFTENASILFITDLLSKFINGAGNNDFVVENQAKYPLKYNTQNKPMFLYNFTSGIDTEGVKWFFVIQGQYYAVIGEKLYAMIYSNGLISQSDAIVDIRDLKYVGNTPAIAFFVNPYTKQVYSFTGDANLQQIFDASKYTFEVIDNEITHWYDESTQSIYIKTQQGLLVFGPQNTYCLEEYTDTSDIEFVDGDIHIVGSEVDTLRYYHDREGYEDLPIVIETSFWGIGSNEITSIDRWNVTLYDPEHREQDVELTVRSLTDVSTLSETKKLHIDKNAWDKWSHSVLLSYSPKLIKGQAIRLSIKSDSAIQKIVPHIMDNKTSTPTNSKFQV